MASRQSHKSRRPRNPLLPSLSMTPVRRHISAAESLPTEILRKIIRLSMNGCIGHLDPSQLPLSLRSVSPVWAAIADSMPSIWANICVAASQCLPANVQVIKDWLKRSGSTTLRVAISTPLNINPTLLHALISAFLPTSARWRHLQLCIPCDYLPMMLSNPNAPLPSLERLELLITNQPVLMLSPSATRLRQVALVVRPPLGIPHGGLFNLAWNQITHLDMRTEAGTLDVIWNVFTQCPSLRSLVVTARHNFATPYIPFYPHNVFYSELRQLLVFTNSRPGVIGYFLDGLYLPYLQHLYIHFTDRLYDTHIWPKAAILNLRDRALPPLSKVTVVGKTISEADLCDFVAGMKYLEQLEVHDGTTNHVTQAVRALLPRDNNDIQRLKGAYGEELISRGRL